MKLVYSGILAIAITLAGVISTSPAAPVNVTITGGYLIYPLGEWANLEIGVFDSAGDSVGSYGALGMTSVDENGTPTSTTVTTSLQLPPGRYSFYGNGGYTDVISVESGTGYTGTLDPGFQYSSLQVDPPIIVPGNQLVEGSIDMQGRRFNLGTSPLNDDMPAFSLRVSGSGSKFFSESSTSSAVWIWRAAGWSEEVTTVGMTLNTGPTTSLYLDTAQALTNQNIGDLFHPIKFAVGSGTASGSLSFASGQSVTASGTFSGAFGLGTTAQGYNQFVVGQYNTLLGSGGVNTNANDPLFIVGNGSNAASRSNAFLIERDGDTQIAGKLIVGGAYAENGAIAALGVSAYAAGPHSIAFGRYTAAFKEGSSVLGYESFADGVGAVAIGTETGAQGDYSIAMGQISNSIGSGSVAIGTGNFAGANNSVAVGTGTQAHGAGSVALGTAVQAKSKNQVVLGRYNVVSGDPQLETPVDDLLIVGNGTDETHRSNAVTVKKNGDVNVAGKLRVWPSGDLSMGTFKSGTRPNVGVDPGGP